MSGGSTAAWSNRQSRTSRERVAPKWPAFLSSVEDIVNEVAPGVLAEVRAEDARKERAENRWWRRKR